MLTQQKLKSLLHYNHESGVFTWKVRAARNVKTGSVAGSTNGYGHRQIRIDGKIYYTHRLAWLYVYGQFPADQIDHRNGVKHDNRIANLREATNSQNGQNQRRCNSDSRTGFLGVCRHGGGWQAQITLDGKNHYVGTYSTPELAHSAYVAAKRQLHIGCTI